MAALLKITISHGARLVLDIREWAGTVNASQVSITIPGQGEATPAIRFKTAPTVTATPCDPPVRSWPFSGPVELVCVRSPSGLLAFHGRVRSPNNGPLRRITIDGAVCDLTIEQPGLRPAILKNVRIPKADELPETKLVYLYPMGVLPDAEFGPTLLSGTTTEPDGKALKDGLRVLTDFPDSPVAEADADGNWFLEFDPNALPTVPLTVIFQDAKKIELHREANFRITHLRNNRYPRTTLEGAVQTKSGRPLAGASVEADGLSSTAITRPDGRWLIALGLDQPISGSGSVRFRVGAPGAALGPQVPFDFGRRNSIPTITV